MAPRNGQFEWEDLVLHVLSMKVKDLKTIALLETYNQNWKDSVNVTRSTNGKNIKVHKKKSMFSILYNGLSTMWQRVSK